MLPSLNLQDKIVHNTFSLIKKNCNCNHLTPKQQLWPKEKTDKQTSLAQYEKTCDLLLAAPQEVSLGHCWQTELVLAQYTSTYKEIGLCELVINCNKLGQFLQGFDDTSWATNQKEKKLLQQSPKILC